MDGGLGTWLFIIVLLVMLFRALGIFFIFYGSYNILVNKNKEKKYYLFLFLGFFILLLTILFVEL